MSPLLRRLALPTAVAFALAILFITGVQGFATDYPMRLLQGLAVAAAGLALLGGVIGLITTRMTDYTAPEDEAEFERLVQRSERLARENLAAEPEETEFLELDPHDPQDFEELVREALDDLPDILRAALDRNVAVVISDGGRKARAYGLYHGDGVARDEVQDRIIIYRDTLLRDFGHDAELLREQVTITVRHELAHHLGADELGVRELGL